jgi:dienelactone hydrolase
MTALDSTLFRPHDEAPAIAALRPMRADGAWSGLDGRHLEYVSRGDFVSGVVHLPDSVRPEPAPLVLLIHGTGESADAASLDLAADWVRRGFAVARIDLPLHGVRQSPKLSERLIEGVRQLAGGTSLDADTRALVQEFARQSTSDVVRGVEALAQRPEIDADRVALVGRGVGGSACAWARPFTPGLRGIALLGDVGLFSDEELSPGTGLSAAPANGAAAPALLVLDTAGADEDPDYTSNYTPATSTESARALFETASEPKRLESAAGGDQSSRVQAFLEETLQSS